MNHRIWNKINWCKIGQAKESIQILTMAACCLLEIQQSSNIFYLKTNSMNHTVSYVLSLGLKDGSEQQKNVYQGIAKVYTKTSAI